MRRILIKEVKNFSISAYLERYYYLEMYKKAFRKNSAFKYREIRALLDLEAVVIEDTACAYGNYRYYEIVTRRTFEGCFGKPLKDHEKIILE